MELKAILLLSYCVEVIYTVCREKRKDVLITTKRHTDQQNCVIYGTLKPSGRGEHNNLKIQSLEENAWNKSISQSKKNN